MPLNINWQQILLHAFNFLILTFGLYWFLYAPIRKFIEEREKFYRNRETETEQKLNDAQVLLDEHKAQLDGLQQEMQAYSDKVRKETNEKVQERIENARKQEMQILQEAHNTALRQKQLMMEEAKQEMREFALETAKRITTGDQEDMYDDFLEHVDNE